jgi:hypothetical protein
MPRGHRRLIDSRRCRELDRAVWQQLEAAQKHPEGSGKVINALAMVASYDPNPTQFLGIRLPVTLDTCEVIEERWANWARQDLSLRSTPRRTISAG